MWIEPGSSRKTDSKITRAAALGLAGCPVGTGTTTETGTDTTLTGPETLVDNGDGTSTGSLSGLTWENEGAVDGLDWNSAVAYCTTLDLAGGGWHLPTIGELRTLIRGCPGTETDGSCGVTDACVDVACRAQGECYSCDVDFGPTGGCYGPAELGNACDTFWSSSDVPDATGSAWFVSFNDGHVWSYGLGNHYHARCVRP